VCPDHDPGSNRGLIDDLDELTCKAGASATPHQQGGQKNATNGSCSAVAAQGGVHARLSSKPLAVE